MEAGLRGGSAHGQGLCGAQRLQGLSPELLRLLGSHLPSPLLLLPEGGLSPRTPLSTPGCTREPGEPAGCQPGSPGREEVFGEPPGPGTPQHPQHRRPLPREVPRESTPGKSLQGQHPKISSKPEEGGQGEPITPSHDWGAHPELALVFTELPLCCGYCQNLWEFRGFTDSLLRSGLMQGTAATLGPVGGAGTGQNHLEVPVACSFAFSPLEGHPEGLLGADSPPSLRVLHPKAAAACLG